MERQWMPPHRAVLRQPCHAVGEPATDDQFATNAVAPPNPVQISDLIKKRTKRRENAAISVGFTNAGTLPVRYKDLGLRLTSFDFYFWMFNDALYLTRTDEQRCKKCPQEPENCFSRNVPYALSIGKATFVQTIWTLLHINPASLQLLTTFLFSA